MTASEHTTPQKPGRLDITPARSTAAHAAQIVEIEDLEGSDLPQDPLNDTERKALLLLLEDTEPGAEMRPLKDIADRLGITQRQLTRIRGKAAFQEEFRAMVLKRIERMIPAVLNAAYETARQTGREGHADRKLILGLAYMTPGAGGPGRGNFGRAGEKADGDGLGLALAVGERLGRVLNETERRVAEMQKAKAHALDVIDVTPEDET